MKPRPQSDPRLLESPCSCQDVPDAISELGNFLHLRWGPYRSVGIRLDAADVHDNSRSGKQVLNLDSEVRQDAGDTAKSDPIGGHLGAATTT